MNRALVLIYALMFSFKAFSQPDTSKQKELNKYSPKVILESKRVFYEKSNIPQKEMQEAKGSELLQRQGNVELDQQIKPKIESLIADQRESISKAVSNAVSIAKIEASEEEMDLKGMRLRGPSRFDSRIELRQLDPFIDWQFQILKIAGSVGLVIRKEELHSVSDSIMTIDTRLTLEKKFKLCPNEGFASQPVAGVGTAFITGDSIMMTALHVFEGKLDQYAVIFGFEILNRAGAAETFIPITNIYYPSEIISSDEDLDIAVFRLNRSTPRQKLKLSESKISVGKEVYMIGYPSGLPQKVALNAGVTKNDHPQYFFTSLDAFLGNSGSPVFDLATNEIIGILVSGETDYRWNGSCNSTTLCRIPFCEGEKVVKISEILKMDSIKR